MHQDVPDFMLTTVPDDDIYRVEAPRFRAKYFVCGTMKTGMTTCKLKSKD